MEIITTEHIGTKTIIPLAVFGELLGGFSFLPADNYASQRDWLKSAVKRIFC